MIKKIFLVIIGLILLGIGITVYNNYKYIELTGDKIFSKKSEFFSVLYNDFIFYNKNNKRESFDISKKDSIEIRDILLEAKFKKMDYRGSFRISSSYYIVFKKNSDYENYSRLELSKNQDKSCFISFYTDSNDGEGYYENFYIDKESYNKLDNILKKYR